MDTIAANLARTDSAFRKAARYALGAVVFAIPWENMVVLPGIGTISRVLGLVSLLMAVLAVLAEKRARSPIAFHGLVFVFLWWCILSFFWSSDADSALTFVISLGQIFVFVCLLWEFADTEENLAFLLKAYVAGAYVSAFATILAFVSGEETNYLRYSARGFDPNDLALILALAVPMAWQASVASRSRIMAILFGLYVPVAAVAVVLTGSRASFAALLVACLFLFWTFFQLTFRFKCALLLLLLVGGAALFLAVPASSWERIASASTELSGGTLNGRLTIWSCGVQALAEQPFLGVGAGNFHDSIDRYLGRMKAAHNSFLGVLVEQGIIGFLVFAAILLLAFNATRRMPVSERRMWIILLLTWMVGAMSVTWILRKPTWLLLALAACRGALPQPSARIPAARATARDERGSGAYPSAWRKNES